jgi:hypothetical protein
LKALRRDAPPAPAAESRARAFGRTPAAYALASAAVLIPCFWQSRIQAGDLGSHIYNSWLAQMAGQGEAPGLKVVSQTTNVLFDLMLAGLFRLLGAAAAQRIAVSLAVLVFFWGALAFVRAASGRFWTMAPGVAALSYGWVFHMGFFNFYLSLGLCFWAMALLWEKVSPRRLGLAAALMLLAYTAHALPIVWAAGALAYAWVWRISPPRARWYLLGASLGGLVLLRAAIVAAWRTRWYTSQGWRVTGADQLWVYGDKYIGLEGALVAVWVWIAIWRVRSKQPWNALMPVALVTAAAIFLIPTAIWIPGYQHQLAFIAQRMSLPLAVAVCALLAGEWVLPWQTAAMSIVVLGFFAFLYNDEAALNDFEDQVDQVVAQVPARGRVVLSVRDDDIQANALTHMIDRACIGRCWSYGNYEPSSAQFRVRVEGPSSVVVSTDADAGGIEAGSYVVKPGDLPLSQIVANNGGQLLLRAPPAGQPIGTTAWHGL